MTTTPSINRRNLLRAGTISAVPAVALGGLAGRAEAGCRVRERDVARWTAAYLDAWREKDADAAARLFTEDAVYAAVPGVPEQTFRGRAEIRRYWTEITAPQTDMTGRHGVPLCSGDRAAVELWVTMRLPADGGGTRWVTLIESNVLYFDRAMRCSRNVEYWNMRDGRLDPPPGWGER